MNKTQIKNLKKAVSNLSRWDKSGKAFGHIARIDALASDAKKSDRLYEFYCLTSLLYDLKKNYVISVEPNPSGKFVFPLSPAEKKTYSYFIISDKLRPNLGYQVCYGTNVKISDAPESGFAPDISIQKKGASNDPDETDVLVIYDAKYKSKKSKLDISIIREFAQCVSDMNTYKAKASRLKFNKLVDFSGNCLITNGEVIDKHRQYCKKNHVRQIGSFELGSIYVVCG